MASLGICHLFFNSILSFPAIGVNFERKSRFPKLLKTLKTQPKGWSQGNETSCLEGKCSPFESRADGRSFSF
jgi:hypothetical protein